jgi:LacI family transcriptional regulator
MAVGAMQAAREFSLSIPKDVSIVGIDDNREASLVTPPLTTVKQPLVEMGRMAVSILTRILENHQLEPLHVELATTLVVRESTGPCPVKS